MSVVSLGITPKVTNEVESFEGSKFPGDESFELFPKTLDGIRAFKKEHSELKIEALRNKEGQTPLHEAAALGRIESIQALNECFPQFFSMCDAIGFNPMHTAVTRGKEDAIRALNVLNPGLIRKRDNNGLSPLRLNPILMYRLFPDEIPLSYLERQTMGNWVDAEVEYLDNHLKLPRMIGDENKCAITLEPIYDLAELPTIDNHKHKFERHALLRWLLSDPNNSIDPINKEEVTPGMIRRIFAERKDVHLHRRSDYWLINAKKAMKYAIPVLAGVGVSYYLITHYDLSFIAKYTFETLKTVSKWSIDAIANSALGVDETKNSVIGSFLKGLL